MKLENVPFGQSRPQGDPRSVLQAPSGVYPDPRENPVSVLARNFRSNSSLAHTNCVTFNSNARGGYKGMVWKRLKVRATRAAGTLGWEPLPELGENGSLDSPAVHRGHSFVGWEWPPAK